MGMNCTQKKRFFTVEQIEYNQAFISDPTLGPYYCYKHHCFHLGHNKLNQKLKSAARVGEFDQAQKDRLTEEYGRLLRYKTFEGALDALRRRQADDSRPMKGRIYKLEPNELITTKLWAIEWIEPLPERYRTRYRKEHSDPNLINLVEAAKRLGLTLEEETA